MSLDHVEREPDVVRSGLHLTGGSHSADVVPDPRFEAAAAERAVLGGQLIFSEFLGLPWLPPPPDYSTPRHQLIARAIAECARRGAVDTIVVFTWLEEHGDADKAGGLAYLTELAQDHVPSKAGIKTNAKTVVKRAQERREAAARAQAAALLRGTGSTADVLLEVREIVAELEAPQRRAAAARFPLLGAAALSDLPRRPDRVRGVFPSQGIAGVYGPSGAGKSFFITSITAAVCEGSDGWFGRRVLPGRCMYAALEGQAGVPRRIEAWEVTHGRPFPNSALFMLQPFRITDRDDVAGLADAIKSAGGVDVVIIDTLNRAAPDVDENSSADMGRVIEGARDLQAATGGLVVLVHHSGKDAQRGMRGHSSLFAALDAAIEVSRVDDRREWKVTKSKDGEDGAVHPFALRQVELGEDDEGAPITSCVVVEPDSESAGAQAPRARPPKGGNQRIVFEALGPLLKASEEFGRGGAPAIRPCVTVEAAIEGSRGRLVVEAKRHGERARAAITGLIAAGVLGSGEGWLWLR